jgi:hypothetical protein
MVVALLSFGLLLDLALGAAPAAYAKGPTAATIEGPGLAGPVTVESYEATQRLPGLGDLMRLTGGSVLFGDGPTFRPDRPDGDLGPRFAVAYYMGKQVVLIQELYPFGTGGPFVFTPAGQRSPFTDATLPDGWFAATKELASSMLLLGASQTATQAATQTPTPAPQPAARQAKAPVPAAPTGWGSAGVLVVALAGVALVATAGAVVLRGRAVGPRR